ncbi:uncharacterized protein LOC122615162 isoform X2 [Drosophila teissieri]|uniref:uncharacterized protein LOC122615162 isoform X2 n=1 Tax=Drosophila teissieri TaxID=7243 RepID=UPI001CB9FFC1|nr:uncharacterized protein LOC122615162 isoform X2 [Drosophila teissieri]
MSQQHPHHAHPHHYAHHYPPPATPMPLQQEQQQQAQLLPQQQHANWYSHVASYPTPHSAFGPAPSCKATNNSSSGNNNNIMDGGGYGPGGGGTQGYYGAAGGGLNVSGAVVSGGGPSYGLGANTVAYAHNQLLQYQQQQQQQHQHLPQHIGQQRPYMGHNIMTGSYPYIKSEPMEAYQQPPNPMAPPPAPEVLIKSEPIDEHSYKSNYIDDNTPFADFSKFSEFSEDMLSPKVELTVKDESYGKSTSSFLRRKQQSDRGTESLPICQRCKEVFFKKQVYVRHVAESNCGIQEYDFKCSTCPMSFMTTEELQRHKLHHRADRFFCHKYCGKHFDTIAECEAHEYMQHEYDGFVCNMCSGTFATREQLYAHLPQHKFQQRFDCPICRLWYQTAVELHEHRLAAPYFCGKYYTGGQSSSASLSQSQAQQHQTNYKLQDCHMATMEMTTTTHHKTTPSGSSLPATAALNSLLQQRQANADGAAMFAASAIKNEVNVKMERSYSNSTSESSYSVQDSAYNNTYGSDSSMHAGAIAGPQAHSSTLDDSEDALCCVPLCGVRKSTSPTLQFFTFPKDEKYLNQWLHNLKMFHIPAASYANFRICSMHFPKRCINRYSLCYWAVPTFNLGHDDVANLYQNRELTNTFTTGEVARCSMPHCTSQRGESNLKFYNFPKDIKSLIKWCQNARLPVQAKEPRHFCSRHFEERCIGKFRLKPWAVPTLHLGAQYGKIHDNPKNLYVEEKRCCLNFCRRSRSSDFNMSLYRFPRDEVLLRRWCYNLRLDPGVYRGKNHKICSAHFIKEALGLRKLSPGAVPTLHLGHTDTFNIYENELWPPPTTPNSHSSGLQHHTQHHPSQHSLQQQLHSKSYQRQSAASTSSSASSANSHYVDPDLSASYLALSASGSSAINASDSMDVCCVPSCESKRHNNENITFHTIPRRPEQMRKWCHNLKIPEEKMHKGMRICSLHFEPYCIGGCMRPFAVPTLNLGHDDDDIHKNPDVIKKLNIRETCCVAVCKRNRDRDHANLHRFPSNVSLLTKWCGNLQRPVPDGSKLFNDAICEVHFEERCLRNKRLEKWAVPTLSLGHESIPYPLPTPEQVTEFYARPTAPNNGDEQGECCVETCKRNPSVDDIKLYRPPEEASVLAKWAHNLQTESSQLTSMRICNLHFEAHCIGKRMRPWAIPTLNLAGNIENLYENPEHSMLYKRRTHLKTKQSASVKPTWVPRCCLPHCRKVRALHNVQLYRFPKLNRSTLAKWAHNLQVPMVGSAQRRLCSAHFEPHVLSKKCPVPLAVPTLDLNAPPGLKIYQNPAKLKASKLCLQRVCIVESCRKTRAQGVQLFRLPHSPTQLRKWMHNIKTRPRAAMRAQYRVCSRHFETHSFNGRRLSAGAIPTLELGHDDEDIYPNEAQAFADEHCVVEGCEASKEQPDVRLFRFPTEDDDMLWKWCNNLKMNPVDCTGVRICNKHFEADCIGPKHLYKWAIPTEELGHDDAEIELILNPKPEDRYVDPVFKCIVPTCGKTRRFDEVQMNSFPKDANLFERWKHNLRLEHLSFQERDRYKICNSHFEDICIGKTRLNIGSIPTLELGHDDTDDLFQVNPAELQSNLFGRQRRIQDELGGTIIKQEFSESEDVKTDVTTMSDAKDLNTRQVKLKRTMSDLKCCVRSCGRSRLEHGARLFPFPNGKQQHLKWRHNLRLEPDEVERSTRICSAHFNRRCIDGKHLRSWAMPTQQLGHQEQPIYENPKNIPGFFTPTCALSHCRKRRSIDNDLRTYRYPRSEDLLEKWRANLRLAPDQCRGRICADHFEAQVRGKLKLKTGAVPTLNLGHDEGLIYDNEAIKVGMAEEEEGSSELPRLKTKRELIDEEEEELEAEEEHHEQDIYDEDEKDGHYFDPLELVETFAEHPSDDEGEYCGDEEDERVEEEDVEEAEHFHPDAPPTPPIIPLRREKPANNVTPICCLKHCRKERTAFHLLSTFGFPKDRQLLLKWCSNLHLNPDDCIGRVCIEHFQPEVLGTRKLKQNAVPTLNVGHDDPLRYSCNGVDLDQEQLQPQHSVFRLWSLKHCRKRKLTEPPDIRQDKWSALEVRKMQTLRMEMKVGRKIKLEVQTEREMMMKEKTPTKNHRESNLERCCISYCANADVNQLLPLPEEQNLLKKWQLNLKLSQDTDFKEIRVCLKHFEAQVVENGKPLEQAVPTLMLDQKSWNIYRNHGSCLFPECGNSSSDHLSFVNLPENVVIKDAWIRHLNLPPSSEGLLCGDHFMHLFKRVELPKVLAAQDLEDLKWVHDELKCAVPSCSSKCDRDLQLTPLPDKDATLLKWLHNTKISYDHSRHKSYRICFLHFEPMCLEANFLKTWSIPTMHLRHDDEIHLNISPESRSDTPNNNSRLTPLRIKTDLASLESPCSSASPSPRGRIRICCISTCGQIGSSQIRLYRFPTEEQALLRWLVNTQQQPRLVDPAELYVCQTHFEPDAICKKQLRCWAEPTLNLGHDGLVIPNAKHNGNIAGGQDTEEAMRLIRERYCSILTCFQGEASGIRLYEYPKDMPTIRKWAAACRHRSMQASSNGFKVCQSHFAPECFEQDTLNLIDGSVPTLELSRSDIERHCLVSGCEKDPSGGRLRFYKVPKTAAQLNAWSNNLKISSVDLGLGEQLICERHFEPFCFGAHKGLRPGALPTIILGHDEEVEMLPNPESLWQKKAEVCCAPDCGRIWQPGDTKFSGFPKTLALAKKWIHNLKLSVLNDQLGSLKVCSAHFEASLFNKSGLISGSIPTLELGHSSQDIFQSDTQSLGKSLKCERRAIISEVDCIYPECKELCKTVSFNLPHEENLRRAWLRHLKIEEPSSDGGQLCPLHFVILYELSIKSFPEHVSNRFLEENYYSARNNRRVKIVSCAVKGCEMIRPRDKVLLHGLPQREDILRMWVENGQLEITEPQQQYMLRVCRNHFESRCSFDDRRLHPWSVPTLNLPGNPVHQIPTKEEWQEMTVKFTQEADTIKLEREEELEEEQLREEEEGDSFLLEPIVRMEHIESDEEDSEMQALEVLLEVGHVERMDSYERVDKSYTEHAVCHSNSIRNQYNANHCAVEGCEVTVEDVDGTIKLHKFPASSEAARKWMHNTQVDMDEKFWWRYRICSYHFEQECFQSARIKKGAMPTLLLGPKRPEEVYENEFALQETEELILPEELQFEEHKMVKSEVIKMCLPTPAPPRKSSKFCQIEGCMNHLSTQNITLHKFPHSEDMCLKWQHNTQVPFDPLHRWRYRICSAHFHPVCLLNMRLVHGSVPTLKLSSKAPTDLFNNDFEAINLRLDKKLGADTNTVQIKEEDEDSMPSLEPELQLHEDQEAEDSAATQIPFTQTNWKGQLSLPVKQETVTYNQVKSGYDKCSLAHCQRQRSKHGVHIYKFPKSRIQQERWMHNLRIRYDERRPWKFMICSVHFEPHCISLRKLRPWAVPTLELGDNVPEKIFTNEQCHELFTDRSEVESNADEDDGLQEDEDEEDEYEEDMGTEVRIKRERRSKLDPWLPGQVPPWKVKQCCLPYCRAFRGDGIKLFRLPNNRTSIRNWELATGMVFKESQRNTRLICSRHFEPELIGTKLRESRIHPSQLQPVAWLTVIIMEMLNCTSFPVTRRCLDSGARHLGSRIPSDIGANIFARSTCPLTGRLAVSSAEWTMSSCRCWTFQSSAISAPSGATISRSRPYPSGTTPSTFAVVTSSRNASSSQVNCVQVRFPRCS